MKTLYQFLCSLRGHGGVDVQHFERDVMDVIEGGHWFTCKKCGKHWEEISFERPKP